jgi:hypothetical protein
MVNIFNVSVLCILCCGAEGIKQFKKKERLIMFYVRHLHLSECYEYSS